MANSWRAERCQSLVADVELGGHRFPFRLYTRALELGPGPVVQYYWMDSSRFRITRGRRHGELSNFRNCVGHWWRAMQLEGLERDPTQIAHLILATSHAVLSGGKGQQRVYRDAHLAPGAVDPEASSVPKAEGRRIHKAAHSRNPDRVRGYLDRVLGWRVIDDESIDAMKFVLEEVLGQGVDLVRQRGEDGLIEAVGKLDVWAAKHRKKGGGRLRRLWDLLAYQAKVSFYLCYTNAWITLIPWLRQHRGLDAVSERFLRFWHMQNQPVHRPDSPTVPDVFRGQVLALHPLSGFFMKDPGLCAVAGEYFRMRRYEPLVAQGRIMSTRKHKDLIGAILTAAYLYRQAHLIHDRHRGVHVWTGQEGDLR